MSSALTLTPRYGRDYKTKAEAEKAWKEGKDFTVADFFSTWDGAAVSIRETDELVKEGKREVHIRYAKLAKIAVIKLKVPR